MVLFGVVVTVLGFHARYSAPVEEEICVRMSKQGMHNGTSVEMKNGDFSGTSVGHHKYTSCATSHFVCKCCVALSLEMVFKTFTR